ncbi:MAG: ArsR family transcriptional regulator [Phycisphaeraceae bacterium]|nr:ArsR family transcriptional regulator [Phycisphaeraceae bacterium]
MTKPARPLPGGDEPAALLREAQDRFIAVWGQMSGAWGISRTMAEVHALLYITGHSLCTDDIMERLDISRGNASMSLRALVEWGIAERVHKRGDRKEYFRSEQDVWAMFRAIVRERIKREVDPLLASLYEIRDISRPAHTPAPRTEDARRVDDHEARIDALLEFFRTVESLGHRFVSPTGRGLQLAATMLAKLPAWPAGQEPASRRQTQEDDDISPRAGHHGGEP